MISIFIFIEYIVVKLKTIQCKRKYY